MAYASQSGRAKTSSSSPQAHAICDRCGFRYNFVDLKWQYDWRGAALQNIRILVCSDCYDTPQEQLRAIVVPADPTPIINARVQDFSLAESDYLTISAPTVYDPNTGIPIPPTTNIVTQNDQKITPQSVGVPPSDPIKPRIGLDANAIMPLVNRTHYDVLLPVVSVVANGTTIITVTCSSPHSLIVGSQISALGLSNTGATGFYTVREANTATQFKYEINAAITAGSLLTGSTRIVTALVGLPYDYPEIPQTGI
jgi:hypothetical protein